MMRITFGKIKKNGENCIVLAIIVSEIAMFKINIFLRNFSEIADSDRK